MPVTLAQLRSFVSVVDNGGFLAAADALHRTQSAVSHSISMMERELGSLVLVRRPTVEPTALGVAVLPHARVALASADSVVVTAGQHAGKLSGTVRLAVTSTVCSGLMPELLTAWAAALPHIRVEVYEGDDTELEDWLVGGTVDAGILVSPVAVHTDGMVIGRDHYGAVMRMDHPLAGEDSLSVADLLADPVLISRGGCGPMVAALMKDADPDFRPIQRVYDNAALLSMVSAGIGVTIFPSVGRTMLPPNTTLVPLRPRVDREFIFCGPPLRPWNPLVVALGHAALKR